MSLQTLRALVNEKLAAAAEEIFKHVEKTIAEYEEELCRSKEENRRKQRLLDQVLSPVVSQPGVGATAHAAPGLNQDLTDSMEVKEEPEKHGVKREEEQLPVSVPESSVICVKTEESLGLQQTPPDHREEPQQEDFSSEVHSEREEHTEHSSDIDNDDNWGPSAAQMETETDGETNTKLSFRNTSAPETSATVNNGDLSGADPQAQRKMHPCSACPKTSGGKNDLLQHFRVRTGEKPYSCEICEKRFAQKRNVGAHMRTHTGQKPFLCLICNKAFSKKQHLNDHTRLHTGEKPYICLTCGKTFSRKGSLSDHQGTHTEEHQCSVCGKTCRSKRDLLRHSRVHTGERPYSCEICDKTFTQKSHLHQHYLRIHTAAMASAGDGGMPKPEAAEGKKHQCSVCKKRFWSKYELQLHSVVHTGQKPYSCEICEKRFSQKHNMKAHMRTHTGQRPFLCLMEPSLILQSNRVSQN